MAAAAEWDIHMKEVNCTGILSCSFLDHSRGRMNSACGIRWPTGRCKAYLVYTSILTALQKVLLGISAKMKDFRLDIENRIYHRAKSLQSTPVPTTVCDCLCDQNRLCWNNPCKQKLLCDFFSLSIHNICYRKQSWTWLISSLTGAFEKSQFKR